MQIYSNSRMREVVAEYLHNKAYQEIFILHFCDGLTFEQTAERVGYSVGRTKEIVKQYRDMIFTRL